MEGMNDVSALSAAVVGNLVGIVVRDGSGSLSRTAVKIDGSRAMPWTGSSAPSPAGSAPALVSRPGGSNVVYLRGNDNQLIARVVTFS